MHIITTLPILNPQTYNLTAFKSRSFVKNNQGLHHIRYNARNTNNNDLKINSVLQPDIQIPSGILDGLSTFKLFKPEDIDLLNDILIINTQRGCNNGCGHCYLMAKPTGIFSEPTIAWESYKQILDDIGTLNERLGFNVLGQKFGFAYNYADADPIEFCSTDKLGEKHNIAEAAKYFYKNIGKPLDFSTAGWNIDNEFENNAAKDVVKLVKSNSEILRNVDVSIHPFHKLMLKASFYFETSKKLRKENPQLSEIYERKYHETRQNYVERMANVLKTFAPVMNPGYSHIDSQYIFENNSYSIFTKQQTELLCNDILQRTYEICINEGIDSFLTRNGIDAFKIECMYPPRKVYNTPRIKYNRHIEFPNTYSVETEDNKLNIVVEPFDKTFYNFFENEMAENINLTLKEDKDSFSKIIINIDLSDNISKKLLDAGFLNNEESVQNYYERLESTINAYHKIPKDKLHLRIRYKSKDTDIIALSNIMTFLREKYPNINNIDLKVKDLSDCSSKSQRKPTEEILYMLQSLKPETRRKFISRMKKAIDIDGNLVLMVYNKPYFGTGNFQDISIKLDDLLLDTNQTYKDKPFNNLLHIKV